MVNKRGLGSTKVKNLRLAIPSDGELYEGALRFLNDCGLVVDRPNARRYTARWWSHQRLKCCFNVLRTSPIKWKKAVLT